MNKTTIFTIKRIAAGLAVFAVSAGAFAADADPTTAVLAQFTQTQVYAAAIGAASLALTAAIMMYHKLKRAL